MVRASFNTVLTCLFSFSCILAVTSFFILTIFASYSKIFDLILAQTVSGYFSNSVSNMIAYFMLGINDKCCNLLCLNCNAYVLFIRANTVDNREASCLL